MASPQGHTKGQHARWQSGANRPPSTKGGGGQDYYHVLGVPYDATSADITVAYRRAMKQNHPDHHIGQGYADAEELAKTLNQAYATLSKPERRRAYDQSIRREAINEQIMNRYVGGFNPPDLSQDILNPNARRRLRRELTAAERRDQRQANRSAIISVGAAFAGIFVIFLVFVLLLALISSVFTAIF